MAPGGTPRLSPNLVAAALLLLLLALALALGESGGRGDDPGVDNQPAATETRSP